MKHFQLNILSQNHCVTNLHRKGKVCFYMIWPCWTRIRSTFCSITSQFSVICISNFAFFPIFVKKSGKYFKCIDSKWFEMNFIWMFDHYMEYEYRVYQKYFWILLLWRGILGRVIQNTFETIFDIFFEQSGIL